MNFHADWTYLCNLELCKICNLSHFFLIKDINIPRFKIKRFVFKYLKYIGTLSLWHHLIIIEYGRKCK